ncbi:hypothetical protein LJC15_00435 [Desulfovibrio sp. OttesenSCG-928-G11]|nr:hypothetical protein [Desulfovibrio sp. OttesenSCG-928-G11]
MGNVPFADLRQTFSNVMLAAIYAVAVQQATEKGTMGAAQAIAEVVWGPHDMQKMQEGQVSANITAANQLTRLARWRMNMFNSIQSFLKTPMGAALVNKFLQQGNEDLQRAFAAGDAMVRLLERAHESIRQKDPEEAKEFDRVARQITADYVQHKTRYLEARANF